MLPKLNSVKACEKCGSPSISEAHGKRAGMLYVTRGIEYKGIPDSLVISEHMLRTCWRCGFEWWEAVLERSVPSDPS